MGRVGREDQISPYARAREGVTRKQRGSGGTEGPTRGQNKKGACRTKLHRERRRRWRLGWSRRGSASAVSWSLPRARARRGVWTRRGDSERVQFNFQKPM